MLFFFGTRATKIKDRKIRRTSCSYCDSKDSFTVSTYSKYFHFFWIPIIPLFKTHVAECSHCKKTYAKHEFTAEMNTALETENANNPARRPLWQGCGCLILICFFIVMFAFSLYGVYLRSDENNSTLIPEDSKKVLLDNDLKQLSSLLQREKDSVSINLKKCIDYDIESGINTEEIEYFSKFNDDKILVLLRIKDFKGIEPKERKVIVDIVEDCLAANPSLARFTQHYIGVEGKWNTLLVQTPTESDLSGRFADKYKLLPFYTDTISTKRNEPLINRED